MGATVKGTAEHRETVAERMERRRRERREAGAGGGRADGDSDKCVVS